MTDCCTTPRARSTRWATRTPRTRSRSSTTAPRSGRAARPRCCTPTVPGRSWTCPSSRSCRPGSMTGTGSGTAARATRRRSTRRGCGTWSACTCAPLTCSSARIPWQPKRNSFSTEGNDLGVPGPRVPAVAALHRLRHARPGVPVRLHQHPPVPHRPGPLRAREVPRPRRRRARRPAPPCRPGTCSPARRATWTSSPTTCGSTAAGSARRPSSRS